MGNAGGGARHINFDEPAAIEIALLLEHVASLAAGRRVDKPVYAFASHTRIGATTVAPAPLVVVEGSSRSGGPSSGRDST